jgi:hypothetical protein
MVSVSVVPFLVLAWWQRQLCCAINKHLSILPASGTGGCFKDVVHAWFDCIETQRPRYHKCSWENILSLSLSLSLYPLLNRNSPLTEWAILLQSAIKLTICYLPLFRASDLWSHTHTHTHTSTCTHTCRHTTSLATRAESWRLQPLRGVPHQM